MDLKQGKIVVNVTNSLNYDVTISLFGSPSDPFASSINARTNYVWDLYYPAFNVANQPYLTIQWKKLGEPTFRQTTFSTGLTYNGLITNLNSLYLGSFWYLSPTFNPSLGYPISTTNDYYVFGDLIY